MSGQRIIRDVRTGCDVTGRRTPTAFHPSAQGCRSRHAVKATLGLRSKIFMNPNGVLINWDAFGMRELMQPRWGCSGLLDDSQGSACRATLGWMIERRWRSRPPGEMLKALVQLEAENQQGMKELEGMLK
jgi:hypothetical protein